MTQDELTAEQKNILDRARRQRVRQSPSEQLYESLLSKAREGQLERPGLAEPTYLQAPPFLPRIGSPRRSKLRLHYWPLAAVAGVLLVLGIKVSDSGSNAVASGEGSEGLEKHPVFQPKAIVSGEPAAGDGIVSLLGDPAFSQQSSSWRVRHWDNLKTDPVGDVPHEFVKGALCLRLKKGQRILGGWPWVEGNVAASDSPAVSLHKGQAYELSFEAWSSVPEATRLLVAMGHATAPYSAVGGARVEWTEKPRRYSVPIVPAFEDPAAGIAFIARMTGDVNQARICLRNLQLQER